MLLLCVVIYLIAEQVDRRVVDHNEFISSQTIRLVLGGSFYLWLFHTCRTIVIVYIDFAKCNAKS